MAAFPSKYTLSHLDDWIICVCVLVFVCVCVQPWKFMEVVLVANVFKSECCCFPLKMLLLTMLLQ